MIIRNWLTARDLLLAGETVQYSEGGNSMLPLIKSHQPVILAPITRPVVKGDIVLVKVGRRHYTHLVLAVRPGQVLIGNNRGRVNGWAALRNVYGVVTEILP